MLRLLFLFLILSFTASATELVIPACLRQADSFQRFIHDSLQTCQAKNINLPQLPASEHKIRTMDVLPQYSADGIRLVRIDFNRSQEKSSYRILFSENDSVELYRISKRSGKIRQLKGKRKSRASEEISRDLKWMFDCCSAAVAGCIRLP